MVEVKELLTACWNKALQLNCKYKQQLTKVEKNSFSEEQINVTGCFLNMREEAVSPQMGANEKCNGHIKDKNWLKKLLCV